MAAYRIPRGSIRKRGPGRYQVRIRAGNEPRHEKTIHGPKSLAEEYLRNWLENYQLGDDRVTPATQGLRAFVLDYLDQVKAHSLSDRTLHDYRKMAVRHLDGELGERPLHRVTTMDLQRLFNSLAEFSHSLRRQVHTIVNQALRYAVRTHQLERNPLEHVEMPRRRRKKKKDIRAMTREELGRFLAAVEGDRFECLFHVAASSGMRPSEYYGLQWSEVDWEASAVRVVQTCYRQKGGGWRFEACKTDGSRRAITLPPEVMARLRRHRQQQLEERLAAARPYEDNNLVFAGYSGRPVSDRMVDLKHFKPGLARAGLRDFRIYDLRHTMATLLLLAGKHPKIVAERLGHASTTLTLDTYSDVVPSMQQEASDALRDLGVFR